MKQTWLSRSVRSPLSSLIHSMEVSIEPLIQVDQSCTWRSELIELHAVSRFGERRMKPIPIYWGDTVFSLCTPTSLCLLAPGYAQVS